MQVGLHDDDEQVCQMEGCTEIDLLPARCSNCHKVFCSQHISGSAHHCTAATDVIVASCPLCHRVVQLEYAGQDVNEAVSHHMDRGCASPPAAPLATPAAAAAPSPYTNESAGSLSFLSRAMHRIMCTRDDQAGTTRSNRSRSGGHRLGGGGTLGNSSNNNSNSAAVLAAAARRQGCGVPGCKCAMGVLVPCDQCGRNFCTEHRNPAQHACTAAHLGGSYVNAPDRVMPPRPANTSSPARAGGERSANTTTNFEVLLAQPSNTKMNAYGKKSESPTDMVTPLVCLLLPSEDVENSTSSNNTHDGSTLIAAQPPPARTEKKNKAAAAAAGRTDYLAIAPFYLHMNRNYALGRVLDLAMDVVTLHRTSSPLPANTARAAHWNMFLLPLPIPSGVSGAMYPAQSLSTLVRNTVLCKGARSVVVLSTLPSLPDELLTAVRKLQKKM